MAVAVQLDPDVANAAYLLIREGGGRLPSYVYAELLDQGAIRSPTRRGWAGLCPVLRPSAPVLDASIDAAWCHYLSRFGPLSG